MSVEFLENILCLLSLFLTSSQQIFSLGYSSACRKHCLQIAAYPCKEYTIYMHM